MIGTLLNGRYRIEAELGRGGIGIVYRAQDTLLERMVAVKVLNESGIGSQGRARLLHEARAAAALNHPNIVGIFDAGQADDITFIVMELLSGESLFDYHLKSLEETLDIASQICEALEHAHARGIVHRDLKRENVIVGPTGQVKLTDFGLARSDASRLSVEGGIVGTVFYLAPEQALGRPVDGRADLYALGVMLYELIAGRLPFSADDPLAVISQHLYAPVIPPSTYMPNIPPALEGLILRLMSKEPENRPASAGEVRQAIAAVQEGSPIPGEPRPTEVSILERLVRGRLVGREREFGEIRNLWRAIAAGTGDVNVLMLSGESGVGKTPLVREVQALVGVSGGRVLKGECYAEGGVPYTPFAQIIREALSAENPALPNAILSDLILLAPDLRVPFQHLPLTALPEVGVDDQRLFESMVVLVTQLCAQKPLLLVIEDMHWADSGTVALLRHLARRGHTAGLRLLILFTYREAEVDQTCCLQELLFDLQRERLAMRMKLGRFDRDQTQMLLNTMFQEMLPGDFADAIYRETDGNLLFIEELCKALIEQGRIYREDGHWKLETGEFVQLPQSIWMALQERIGKLPSQAQETLRLAAVIGREFDFATLHQACELPEDELVDALDAAVQAQLIREIKPEGRRGMTDGEWFSFEHGLIRSALQESVTGLRRHRLHRRVAGAIEALCPDDFEALAYHYEQANDLVHASASYTLAGNRALGLYAYQEAERAYRSAEDLTEGDTERAYLKSQLGEALFRQGRYNDAMQVWQAAIESYRLEKDIDHLARLYARSARAAWYGGSAARGLELCQEGMAMVPANAESPGVAALLHETARAYRFNLQYDPALPLCQQALAMAQRLNLPEVQAETLATLGILPNQTNAERRKALEDAIEISERAGLLATAARARLNLGGFLQDEGEAALALEHVRMARQHAHRLGVLVWEHDYLVTAIDISIDLGALADAERWLAEARQMYDRLPNPAAAAALGRLVEAGIYYVRGEVGQAADLLEQDKRYAQETNDPKRLANACLSLVEAYTELGRLEDAEANLQASYEIALKEPVESIHLAFVEVPLRLRMGQTDLARQALDKVKGEEAKGIRSRAIILWCQARLAVAEGRWAEARAAYETVWELMSQYPASTLRHRAMLCMDWGDALAAHHELGDLEQAKEHYRQAQAIYEQIGAPPRVELAQQKINGLKK